MVGRRFLGALLAAALLGAAGGAGAADYRSIAVPAAILYDAPSAAGKKLYLIRAQTPVEVVVRLAGWFKVRDVEGTLAWVDARQVSDQRTLMVTAARAVMRQADRPDAAMLVELDKGVAVDFLESAAAGWVKVRHRDGATGFVRANEVWGL